MTQTDRYQTKTVPRAELPRTKPVPETSYTPSASYTAPASHTPPVSAPSASYAPSASAASASHTPSVSHDTPSISVPPDTAAELRDDALVAQARNGNREAFELLVRRYEQRILALTCRMCGSAEDGAEAAQEAFLSAWLGLPGFRGEANFSTWLYRLASNACIDQLRRSRRHEVHAGPSLDDADTPEFPDPAPSPQTLAERAELRREIENALQDLSPDHRQILILREMHQLSYGEIGRILDLEPGTVKSRVSRARSALRKILLGTGNFSAAGPSIQTGEEGKA